MTNKILLSRSLFPRNVIRVVPRRLLNLSPIERYDQKVAEDLLKDDPYQRKIILNLSILHGKLETYKAPVVETPNVENLKPKIGVAKYFESFFGKGKKEVDIQDVPQNEIKGIYLWGDVGCGKTMLMDLFYLTVPKHLPKRRFHFHQFMQNLHKRSHQLKVEHNHMDLDVIPLLAAEIAQTSTVLCFDEFQVTDVADAMLLRRLMTLLLNPDHGVILFATSNRAPDDLYMNGIQRVLFIPCIQLIKKQTRVIYLNSPTDYRKIPKPISSVYQYPKPGVKYHSKVNSAACLKHVQTWFDYFNQHNTNKDVVVNDVLIVWGRQLKVPLSSKPDVAQFTFDELCGKNLSAGDYLTLANTYKSFIITDIPYLSTDVRDKVRRFITFLDAVYDAHGRIATTGAAAFKDIFVEPEELSKDNYLLYKRQKDKGMEETFEDDELVVKHGFDKLIAKKASMFVNDEEKFAFARALSRLTQMGTTEWIEAPRELH
ncbi:CIC11C00000000961 [Sungouiella intermedia]|uniref:CIC11C00000000961 n=1 Tax=Sungouiella intermedia TaxID=45354 RepID=A0A1L0DBI0_9ASCO|nr:CIC11C00000000961 [[Candida] intermedia]